jgi:hypothetical protein
MRELNPRYEVKSSNPSPGALIEGISEGYKADESEQQAKPANLCHRKLLQSTCGGNNRGGYITFKAGLCCYPQ